MKPIVIIYHSILGIRGSEQTLADLIKDEGFDVVVPDFFDGNVFDDYGEAMKHLGTFAEGALEQRAVALFEDIKQSTGNKPTIFVGFSNGCNIAQSMALQNEEAVGVILFHGGLPSRMFGYATWPSRVPVQIFYSKDDPWKREDQEFLDEYLEQLEQSGISIDFYEYDGEGHLFTDPDLLEEFNEEAAQDAYRRVKEFLLNYK